VETKSIVPCISGSNLTPRTYHDGLKRCLGLFVDGLRDVTSGVRRCAHTRDAIP